MIYQDNVIKFISIVEPIIIKNIKQYKAYIDGYTFDDLYHEGIESALNARKIFTVQDKEVLLDDLHKCYINKRFIFWVKRNIQDRFKELTKMCMLTRYTYSIDDVGSKYLADDSVQKIVDMILDSGGSGDNDFMKELSERVLKNLGSGKDDKSLNKTQKKFLKEVLSDNLSSASAAKAIGVTRSRISQLKSEINITAINYHEE